MHAAELGAFRKTAWSLSEEANARGSAFNRVDISDAEELWHSPVHPSRLHHIFDFRFDGCAKDTRTLRLSTVVRGGAVAVAAAAALAVSSQQSGATRAAALALAVGLATHLIWSSSKSTACAPATPTSQGGTTAHTHEGSAPSTGPAKDTATPHRGVTGVWGRLPDSVAYNILTQYLGLEGSIAVARTSWQIRIWAQDHARELIVRHIIQGPRLLRSLTEYRSWQAQIREVYALPAARQPHAIAELRTSMSDSILDVCRLQAYGARLLSLLPSLIPGIPPPVSASHRSLPAPSPPLPPAIVAAVRGPTPLDPPDPLLLADPSSEPERLLSGLLLFVFAFDDARAKNIAISNDLSFWMRGLQATRMAGLVPEKSPADDALPPADMLTLRAFISCPNPMLSALESAIRAQPRYAMLALCAALERVMRRCLALDQAVRAAEEGTGGTGGGGASPAPEPHLLLLTYAMVVWDRVTHAVHHCSLQEGFTGRINERHPCNKGICSLERPGLSARNCITALRGASPLHQERLQGTLINLARTPRELMESFLGVDR